MHPANKDFASVAYGQRFMVDLAQARTWRVCTQCLRPDLLGDATSKAFIHELLLRVTPPDGASTDVVTVNATEILFVDGAGAPTRRYDPATLIARVKGRTRLFRIVDSGFVVLTLGTGFALGGMRGLVSMAYLLAILFAGRLLDSAVSHFRRSWSAGLQKLALAAAWLAAIIVVGRGHVDHWLTPWVTVVLVVGGAAAGLITQRLLAPVLQRRGHPQQGARWMEDPIIGFVGPGHELELVAIRGDSLFGEPAIQLLTKSIALDIPKLSAQDAADVATLCRQMPNRAAIAAGLRVVRPDDDGRYSWNALPLVWRAAISMALINDGGNKRFGAPDMDELNRVADIARSLDPST